MFARSLLNSDTQLNQQSYYEASASRPAPTAPLQGAVQADVVVVGLVGERGREVREFIERDLGAGLARSVVVVATSDQTPLLRLRCALAGTAVAE